MPAAWYAAATKPQAEMLAATHLRRQGFDVWVPQVWERRRRLGQVIPVLAPLFANYLFVEADLSNDRWRSINGTRGVKRMLQFGDGRPLPIPERTVADLRRRIGDGPLDEAELSDAMRPLLPGDSVTIMAGAFENFTGAVISTAAARARVLLAFFGRQTEVEVDSADLRRVE